MEERDVVVHCDESVRSDVLIERLKDYDRRLSLHTFGEFERMSDFKRARNRAIVGEVVDDIGICCWYIRCIIRGSRVHGNISDFYDCVFIGTEYITESVLHGESLSTHEDPVVEYVSIPNTCVRFDNISIERFNAIACDEKKVNLIKKIPLWMGSLLVFGGGRGFFAEIGKRRGILERTSREIEAQLYCPSMRRSGYM